VQFIEGAAKPAARSSSKKHLVRGTQHALMDRMSFFKKIIEACVLDKERHATLKHW